MEDEPDLEASGNSKKRKLTSEESDDDNPPVPELKSKVKKRKRKVKHRTPKVIPHRQHLFRAREACGASCPVKTSSIQDLVFFVALNETGSIPAQPNWCNVPRVEKIKKVVMVFVSGIGAIEYTKDRDCFSQYNGLYQHCIETKVSGPDIWNIKLPHESLLSVVTPETKSKQNKEDDNIIFSREDYILTIDQMWQNDYHLPSDCDTSESKGFLSTKTYEGPTNAKESPMYAVDCEMCGTAEGLELTRISVVDESLNVIYDTLVKPSNPIVDYLTQYSGITAEMLENVTTTLADVQKRLIDLLPHDAILLGHSLENDLRALKLHHGRVIDTSVIYGDIRGALFKSSLRYLAQQYLKKKIQTGNDGHCSIEDARTCMQLVQLKIQNGSKFGSPPVADKGFFEHIACSGKIASMLDYPGVLRRFSLGATHAIACRSDEEIVSQAVKLIPSSEILWAHLHEPEMFCKERNSNIEGDQGRTWQDVLRSVDCRIKQIQDAIKSQPIYSLLLVMLGGGDQSLVRRLQRGKKTDKAELKKAVKSAGKGLCFIQICRQKQFFPQKGMETSGTTTE